jgi:hypothetical protein
VNFNYSYPPGQGNPGMALVGGAIAFFVWLVVLFFMIYVWSRILHKAGYSRWLALLLLVPLANIALVIWFAFATWPLEQRAMGGGQMPQGGGYQQPAPQPAPETRPPMPPMPPQPPMPPMPGGPQPPQE